MEVLGMHYLVEFYQCDSKKIDDVKYIEDVMTKAVDVSGATIVAPLFHKFAPQGVSGVVVIEESHFAIHTWPEHGYASVDIYSCGEFDYVAAMRYLRDSLGAKKYTAGAVERGRLSKDNRFDEKLSMQSGIIID